MSKAQKWTIAIAVTEQDHARLRQLAVDRGVTLTSVLREWINDGLEAEGQALLQEMVVRYAEDAEPSSVHARSRWKVVA